MKITRIPKDVRCPNIFENLVNKFELLRNTRAVNLRFFFRCKNEIRLNERQISFKEKILHGYDE